MKQMAVANWAVFRLSFGRVADSAVIQIYARSARFAI